MRNQRTWAEIVGESINAVLLLLLAITMIFPFYYILVVSFAPYSEYVQSDLLLWPKQWVMDSYHFILGSKEFIRSIGVTLYVTGLGSLVNLAMTATMAYALSRNIAGQKLMLMLVLFSFLFGAGLIPTYLVVKNTGLIDSFWSLILPVAINPFNLIVMRQFFLGIPSEMSEAAHIDGANELQIFRSIILPLSKPALAAFGLFYAVNHWNTYFSAILYLNDPSKWTVQVVLRQLVVLNDASALTSAARDFLDGSSPPAETIGMAAIIVATLPILLVYPFLQKHFAKGVMLGSVKG
ncbi:carbohydrate ABC transporter permease [Cohnella sp. GCM10027633]|uniref:carbohydrate ABC transporter permease n=1 Tax=unclassified Cohnella TaxID=2636738 RepID=UPI0036388BB6